MTKRWSPQRRAAALKLRDAGEPPAKVATSLGMPRGMVEEYFATLSGKTKGAAKPKVTPAKNEAAKKRASTKKKVTKKKVTKKKVIKKKSGKTVRKTPVPKDAPLSKKARIDALIAATNERLGAPVVRRASDAATDYLLRRPTGILSLDIGLGGGWPASSLCLLTGPDGAGKDFLMNLTMAQQQRIYGDDFACLIYSTEFKFDKVFARDLAGFQVRMSNKELDRYDLARGQLGLPALTSDERKRYQTQIGHVVLVDGVIADDGLDVVLDAVYANEFQVIGVNSLGVLQTAAKEEKDTLRDHAIQSNEAQLLTRFMPHLFMLLNRADPQGNRNETLVLATNQVRAKRDVPRGKPGRTVPERAKYQGGSGSKALAHGKAIELAIHRGFPHLDKEVKPYAVLGKEVDWEIVKGKLGTHEGIQGSFDFWFDDGADILTDLINTAAGYGVVDKSTSHYAYQHGENKLTGHGVHNMRKALAEHPDAIEAIRRDCLREAEIVCLYK